MRWAHAELALQPLDQPLVALVERRDVAGRVIGLEPQPRDGFIPWIEPIERPQDGMDIHGLRDADHGRYRRSSGGHDTFDLTGALDLEPFVIGRRKAGKIHEKRVGMLERRCQARRIAASRGIEDLIDIDLDVPGGERDGVARDPNRVA